MAELVDPTVYDIDDVELRINDKVITGLAPDGFGLTPGGETTLIAGLKGEQGFNIDPSSMAEATVTLKTGSPSNDVLRDIWRRQTGLETPGDRLGPVPFVIEAKPGKEAAIGFRERGMQHAMVTKAPEWSTDEKEAPDVEWTFVGYGYFEIGTTEA